MSKEREIFDVAVEIVDLEARKAFVDESCKHDDALRRRVNDLLQFENEDQSFLSESQLQASGSRNTDLSGTQIGRYKLLEEIGEGGCGIVYMAEQREPLRRKVALKIVKPGMDTREVIARFEAERQALAMMDHPNIARVLDGGQAEHGRPFFVMELVDGVPITEYCDANKMPLRHRMKLFIKVCHAVQHAHQKGIIHRDIKPSNVLITLHDGEAVPRVIDFGVAKALGSSLTDRTLFTRYGQVVGTPQYMSPEQAERSGLDVDTRSDIYSLGVLLYELLTGHTPLDKARLKEAAFDEVLRIVREEEPPTPSTRISTLGDSGTIVSQQRSTEPLRLGKLLRGDLDWIVMRALEKDRRRRFESVGEFIADIERHIADQPVLSGPPSAVYRITKFIRRNRVGVLAASAVVGALIVGLSVAIVGLARANVERNNAIEIASEAQTMLTTLRFMLETDSDTGRGRQLTVRQMLDQFSDLLRPPEGTSKSSEDSPRIWVRNYRRPELDVFQVSFPDLAKQPRVAAEIHSILGNSYKGLDLFDDALVHFHKEYELCRKTYGVPHTRVAWAAHTISHIGHIKGDPKNVRKYGEIAVTMFDKLGCYSQSSILPRSLYCDYLAKRGEAERAEEILRRTMRELDSQRVQLPDREGALLLLRGPLALSLAAQGKHEESLRLGKRVLNDALQYRVNSGQKAAGAHLHIRYGDCLDLCGKTEEALHQYERAREQTIHLAPTNLARIRANSRVAWAHSKLFHFDEAIALLDGKRFEDAMDTTVVFHQLVLFELNLGSYEEADVRCREMLEQAGDAPEMAPARTVAKFLMSLAKRRISLEQCQSICDDMLMEARLLAEQSPEVFSVIYSWALIQKTDRNSEDTEEAIRHAKTAVDHSTYDYLLALAHHSLALAYVSAGRFEQDSKRLRLAIEQQKLAVDNMPKYQLFLRSEVDQQMVELFVSAHQMSEAREFLEQGVKWREDIVPPDNIHIAAARMGLADHLIVHGNGEADLKQAEGILLADRSSIESRPSSDFFRTRWVALLIKLYDSWGKPLERAKWENAHSTVR